MAKTHYVVQYHTLLALPRIRLAVLMGKGAELVDLQRRCTQPGSHTDKVSGMCFTQPGESIHTDLVESMEVISLGHYKYFVTAFDECSGFSLGRFVHRKSEIGDTVIEMIRESENLFYSKTGVVVSMNPNLAKWVRSNGGGEYVGHKFPNWLKQRGIAHKLTAP